jgi:DMSO/TMAO reductase YedYZ molybdopterin-dependent catalytic subunit
VGDGKAISSDPNVTLEELQLANRNRGMPLEALRYTVTPTGMHYLLVHFDIPDVDQDSFRLEVGGLVGHPLSLSVDDIRSRPSVTMPVTMECAGNGRALLEPRPVSQPWLVEAVSTSEWTGTPLRGVLDEAGVMPEAVELVFTGLDRGFQGDVEQDYQRSLTVEDARREEVMLVYEMNGQPLEPQHGFPLRLIVPGWYGMTSVKWLSRIEAVPEPFTGYQMSGSYRYSQGPDEPGDPVQLIRVRALMAPPGIPDFLTRTRVVNPGEVVVRGRAWAGRRAVDRVDFSSDGGATWDNAQLEEAVSEYGWQEWSCSWRATPGNHELCVRAWDSAGEVQSLDQHWTYHGMGNNMVQRVAVIVE